MNTDSSRQPTLYVSSKAMTQLEKQKMDAGAEAMKEKLEAEEAKLQKRRSKQDQQLATRASIKEQQRLAGDSDAEVERCCKDLEVFNELRKGSKKKLERLEEILAEKNRKSEAAYDASIKAQSMFEKFATEASVAQGDIGEATYGTDDSILRLKTQRLQEAWDRSNNCWDKIQKSVRKKARDRSIKKRAKGLLGL